MQETFQNFSYDWLTFSSVKHLELTGDVLDVVDYYKGNKGNGTLNWYTFRGGNSPLILLHDFVKTYRDTVSRLDIAYDVLLDDTTIEYLFDSKRNESINYIRYWKDYRSRTGRSIYFGGGDFILRIYEKGLETRFARKIPELKNWVRFEFQLRGRRVRNSTLSLDNPEEDFKMLAEKYIKAELLEMLAENYYAVFKPFKRNSYVYLDNNVMPYLKRNISDPYVAEQVKKLLAEAKQSS